MACGGRATGICQKRFKGAADQHSPALFLFGSTFLINWRLDETCGPCQFTGRTNEADDDGEEILGDPRIEKLVIFLPIVPISSSSLKDSGIGGLMFGTCDLCLTGVAITDAKNG